MRGGRGLDCVVRSDNENRAPALLGVVYADNVSSSFANAIRRPLAVCVFRGGHPRRGVLRAIGNNGVREGVREGCEGCEGCERGAVCRSPLEAADGRAQARPGRSRFAEVRSPIASGRNPPIAPSARLSPHSRTAPPPRAGSRFLGGCPPLRQYSRAFGRLVGSVGAAHAFEPEPTNFKRLLVDLRLTDECKHEPHGGVLQFGARSTQRTVSSSTPGTRSGGRAYMIPFVLARWCDLSVRSRSKPSRSTTIAADNRSTGSTS